ncbi:hypothetical protein D1AOALGA4SA_4995 [Olavius algarvensis Delta 1 endosymbiont]|nr:hypothetical protein D1AOALGA4SA_4995 [Olavius algarvensis Delta 1 endosymbiont]
MWRTKSSSESDCIEQVGVVVEEFKKLITDCSNLHCRARSEKIYFVLCR